VSADEGYVFHNRLTHSLEVAQIGRRLAEKINHQSTQDDRTDFTYKNPTYINPDVVESACLAHDLGHPPFGHAGEKALQEWCDSIFDKDPNFGGFEGNAQTMRIVTKLSEHSEKGYGLNLCRTTLQAIAKYPWFYSDQRASTSMPKFCFYEDDREIFNWLFKGTPPTSKTIECQIMDAADELTYSLHDFIDLSLAGLIPLNLLASSPQERKHVLDFWIEQKSDKPDLINKIKTNLNDEFLDGALSQLVGSFGFSEAQLQSLDSRRAINAWQSNMLTQYFNGTTVENGKLCTKKVPLELKLLLKFFQKTVWFYVIEGSSLAAQQYGQKRAIKNILACLFVNEPNAKGHIRAHLVPNHLQDIIPNDRQDKYQCARSCVDIVASLSERELIAFYKRLSGHDVGSIRL
jgi:dGTPase